MAVSSGPPRSFGVACNFLCCYFDLEKGQVLGSCSFWSPFLFLTLPFMASNQKIRRIVLTGAVTVITIAGSLYGAGIKTGQQVTQVLCSNHYI